MPIRLEHIPFVKVRSARRRDGADPVHHLGQVAVAVPKGLCVGRGETLKVVVENVGVHDGRSPDGVDGSVVARIARHRQGCVVVDAMKGEAGFDTGADGSKGRVVDGCVVPVAAREEARGKLGVTWWAPQTCLGNAGIGFGVRCRPRDDRDADLVEVRKEGSDDGQRLGGGFIRELDDDAKVQPAAI